MPNRIRTPLSISALLLLIGGATFSTSCSKDHETIAPAVVAEHKFTGQELFKGIFFLEGPVAGKLPCLDSYVGLLAKSRAEDPGLATRKAAYAEQIIRNVQAVEPGYFATLRAAVDSKDFGRIDRTLLHGAYLVEAATQLRLTPRQQQRYQHAKAVLASMDLRQYNLQDDKDLQKFTAAVKSKLAEGTTETGADAGNQQLEDSQVFASVSEFAVFFATSIGIVMVNQYSAWIHATEHDGVGESMKAQNSLEKEMLVKQIAFNLN